MVKAFVDLHRTPEDQRIACIGEAAASGQIIGVALEKNEREKHERYIRKITERFPTVVLLDRHDGPVAGVITLRFGPRPS